MKYQIISDGSCDLSESDAKKINVRIVPFYVSFDDVNYRKEGEDLEVRDFYDAMVSNPKVYPKSSLPSVQDYADVFVEYARQDIPVICICITTKFSGSYNSAINARDIILEEYPDAKISVIDSTINTVLQGLFVREAVSMQQRGISYEENVERLEKIKSSGRIFFTVGSIDYLRAGGRIGKLKGFAADVLGIKPLITLKEGEIFPSGITRSRAKAQAKLISQVQDYVSSLKAVIHNFALAVGYGYDIEEAKVFKKNLAEALRDSNGKAPEILLEQIGATIAVHTGPYPLGVGIILHYDAPELSTSATKSFLKFLG